MSSLQAENRLALDSNTKEADMTCSRWLFTWLAALTIVGGACSNSSSPTGTGGMSGQGGSTGNGGSVSQGGSGTTGGATALGGMTNTGGKIETGGTTSSTGGKAGTGGATDTGGATGSTGGRTSTGGATDTGGATGSTGGRTSTGGATDTGGATGTGGRTGSGGRTGGSGGTTGTGGTTGPDGGSTGGATSGGGYPLKNDPVRSEGCGQALASTTFKAGANTTYKITSASLNREYIMFIPSTYDASKPYRLVFAWHPMGGSDTQTAGSYYGLKAQDTGGTTIFVAPQGYTDSMPWRLGDDKDHIFFDDMLKLFKSSLCIDVSRVFATGFSFGGMETYSLSVNRQKDLRGAVGIAPANYNIYVTPSKSHQPIAWMQTTGMSDKTCPWVNGSSTTQGAKYIGIEHGTDNGCTVPSTIPTWTSGAHLCVDFEGCKAGFPTKVCTFSGGHTDNSSDSGGGGNWISTESWKFITQF